MRVIPYATDKGAALYSTQRPLWQCFLYGHVFHKHTRRPIICIIANDEEAKVPELLIRWFKYTIREALYVHVAISTPVI